MREQMMNGTIQPTKPNLEVLEEEIRMQSVAPQSMDPIQNRGTVHYLVDDPGPETPGPRGLEYGARRMSKGSLVSESTATSGTSDRRAQTIAANREYRAKQQRHHPPQQQQRAPTLPYIDSPHPELMVGQPPQGQAFPNPIHPMPHPGSRNYIPVDSRSASDSSERSGSIPSGHHPASGNHYGHNLPYSQHDYEPSAPMQMPMPEMYSPPVLHDERPLYASDTRGAGIVGRPISPTQSETSSRSASTHPSRGYQANMSTVQEEIPNRYQDRYTATNRGTQSKDKRAKPSNHAKATSARNAVNF
ncbi:hypothetical protein K493DRAFT_42034 [Basidiobolus meristosporus CBS 931.73]|uniref:Uncharacterized protein n=1 Tax=Basidiobolus meristosporus CBS 931.73 TaxID=1314790 RepID=A0A1Y1Y3N6_9FUNG|nr:hypothetical protein K493DRAFT_42034 [Basidiobolus meristosporus CBS 931.73]|eukprot:ORX92607.1 hypothetical protein K493DRAFT_42034 [Basidiobolus meristosporus CBS 931.73]